MSPFARTCLPFIPRPGSHTGHPNPEVGQSAPPLPATAIEERVSAAEKMSRQHLEAASAPTSLELRKVQSSQSLAMHVQLCKLLYL